MCSRSSWVLPHSGSHRSARGALSVARGSALPSRASGIMPQGPDEGTFAFGECETFGRGVQMRPATGCCAARVGYDEPAGPSRPSLRPRATTHAWRLVLGIRCRSGQVRRCGSGCRVVKPPQRTLPAERVKSEPEASVGCRDVVGVRCGDRWRVEHVGGTSVGSRGRRYCSGIDRPGVPRHLADLGAAVVGMEARNARTGSWTRSGCGGGRPDSVWLRAHDEAVDVGLERAGHRKGDEEVGTAGRCARRTAVSAAGRPTSVPSTSTSPPRQLVDPSVRSLPDDWTAVVVARRRQPQDDEVGASQRTDCERATAWRRTRANVRCWTCRRAGRRRRRRPPDGAHRGCPAGSRERWRALRRVRGPAASRRWTGSSSRSGHSCRDGGPARDAAGRTHGRAVRRTRRQPAR